MATAKRPYQKDGRQHSRRSRILWCSECRLAFTAVLLSGLSPQYPSWGVTIRKFYNGHCSDDSSAMSIDVALSTHYGARRNTPLYYGRCGSAATRTEWHVNGHATTTRPLSPFSFFTDFGGFCPPAPICISLRFVVYLQCKSG